MKKLICAIFAVSMTSAAGVVFAAGDEAEDVAPNALLVIVSTPATGSVKYDTDESMAVAPNAQREIEQTTYLWEEDYSPGSAE